MIDKKPLKYSYQRIHGLEGREKSVENLWKGLTAFLFVLVGVAAVFHFIHVQRPEVEKELPVGLAETGNVVAKSVAYSIKAAKRSEVAVGDGLLDLDGLTQIAIHVCGLYVDNVASSKSVANAVSSGMYSQINALMANGDAGPVLMGVFSYACPHGAALISAIQSGVAVASMASTDFDALVQEAAKLGIPQIDAQYYRNIAEDPCTATWDELTAALKQKFQVNHMLLSPGDKWTSTEYAVDYAIKNKEAAIQAGSKAIDVAQAKLAAAGTALAAAGQQIYGTVTDFFTSVQTKRTAKRKTKTPKKAAAVKKPTSVKDFV